MIVLVLPRPVSGGLEERYAADRLAIDLRADVVFRTIPSAGDLPEATEFVALVTDPLFVPVPDVLERLATHLREDPSINVSVAAAPVTPSPEQKTELPLTYSTPFELAATAAKREAGSRKVRWISAADPGLVLVRAASYRANPDVMELLRREEAIVCEDAVIHRFEPLRGNSREDLFALLPIDCRSLLEIGCGEGALGGRVKSELGARVVGIEIDADAAAIARKRLDEVYAGATDAVIPTLTEQFDCIVAGDVLEHLADPWTTLQQLSRRAHAGTLLVASIPNVASWPIVADLLRGRFDYVYAGLLCVGHVRFFTRRSIEHLFSIGGWRIVGIEPQPLPEREEYTRLDTLLRESDVELSPDLPLRGFIITAVPATDVSK